MKADNPRKIKQAELLAEYAPKLAAIQDEAQKAYGPRDTESPQHEASREYTFLLVKFVKRGGSLLDMAAKLGTTYAALRRRVTTAPLAPTSNRKRLKFTDAQYAAVVDKIKEARLSGPHEYHAAIKAAYDEGYSPAELARRLDMGGANPLYFGLSRAKLREAGLA